MMAQNKRFGGWLVPTAIVAVLAGLLGSGVMVWSASNAAFSGTTDNPANSWAAGAVSLSDDDGGSTAMFSSAGNAAGMVSTTPVVKCIVVTYGGSLTAPVKLYGATAGGTGLAAHITLKIDIGTVGTFSSCGAFAVVSTPYNGLLSTFGTTYTNYSNGLATAWSPTGAAQSKVFRFTATVADTGNGLNCTMPFTWEAQA
jgi:hypothetical protein